jgi:hypothetical protein
MATRAIKSSPFGWAFWLFFAVFIGIWQSYPDISTAIEEGGIDYTIYLGPIWIKLIKDAFVVLLWLYLVLAVRDPFPPAVRRAVAWCYLIVILSFALACFWLTPLLAFAGLRWIIAVFVFLELRRLCGRSVNRQMIVTGLLTLLAIHLALQGLRLFTFPPVWGERWGLAARAPGFFLLPNTSALFATACAALVIDLKGRTHQLSRLSLVLATISALLSQSAGGLLACFVLMVYLQFRRLVFAAPVVIAMVVLFLAASSTLLGREDFLEYSGGERIDKLSTAAEELTGLGAFGAYTNTGFMLILAGDTAGGGGREPVISDSFYVSLIGNFGMLIVPLLVFFWMAMARSSKQLRNWGLGLGRASLLCLATFGFSTVVSEAFPMTIMLSIGAWMGAKAEKARAKRTARPAITETAPPLLLNTTPDSAPSR